MAGFGVDRTEAPILTGTPADGLTALGVTSYMQTALTTVDNAAEAQAYFEVDPAGDAIAMAIALG
jgi:hypothetical protein